MTRNKSQKAVTRQRMAETGEPYNVARRAAGNAGSSGNPDPAGMTPEELYAREAQEAGVSAAEYEAQIAGFQAQEAADQARERADQARDRAGREEEAADRAQERADLAQEAAGQAREGEQAWGDEQGWDYDDEMEWAYGGPPAPSITLSWPGMKVTRPAWDFPSPQAPTAPQPPEPPRPPQPPRPPRPQRPSAW